MRDNEIILKKELLEELKSDLEKFKRKDEVSRTMFKMITEYELTSLTEKEQEFNKYCELYKEKFRTQSYYC